MHSSVPSTRTRARTIGLESDVYIEKMPKISFMIKCIKIKSNKKGGSVFKYLKRNYLKEHHIDTETYKKALSGSIAMTGTNVDFILKGINEYLMALAKEQIKLAFEQSEKEVADLHQRTREGLLTARLNGKQVGRKKGVGFETKKARETKQIIRTHCKTFGGTLDDAECMKLTGLARNTYYKYKRQIRAELMAEQDLPKGASIFYEPPKSF